MRFRRLLARTTAGERGAGDVLRNAALARPTPTPALGGGLLPPEGRGGAASGAGERDYDRLASHLTAERCDELLRRGYTVIDAFHGAEWSAALRAELLALAADGALAPNRTLFGGGPDGRALVFSKPHIFEADLHSPALAARFGGALREFGGWFAGSRDRFAPAVAARLPQLQLRAGDGARTVKLQRNAGGGSFPLHYDNPGGPNARALTVLVYLNAAWAPGDGGELVLVPFLGAPVKLAPLMDRAVLFLSDRVLHGTVPSRTERLAVTTWIDGDAPREDGLRLPPSALQASRCGGTCVLVLVGSRLFATAAGCRGHGRDAARVHHAARRVARGLCRGAFPCAALLACFHALS